MTIFLNLLGLISLIIGVYVGYKFAFVIYQYLRMKLPENKEKHTKKLDTFMVVDTVIKEKYNLGLLNLYPNTSSIRDEFSFKELNQIYDIIEKMEELGVQFIYLKPKNQDRLIYKAISLRRDLYKEGYIQLSEYK
ncbi:hypothetical protein SDC9_155403 [bioreactor metagenome]|uniref:Uncharacterized protein n=1 Tax=bioreactor metagenome TaxID=1076179 RepID=A0A645F1E7_9ZZZZ